MFDPLIAARAAHFIATTMVAGALFFAVFVLDPAVRKIGEAAITPRLRRPLTWIIGAGLALALVSGAAWLVLLSAEISGRPPRTRLSSVALWHPESTNSCASALPDEPLKENESRVGRAFFA